MASTRIKSEKTPKKENKKTKKETYTQEEHSKTTIKDQAANIEILKQESLNLEKSKDLCMMGKQGICDELDSDG
jgi:hypothetical protein